MGIEIGNPVIEISNLEKATISKKSFDITGFDRYNPEDFPIMELCQDASSGTYKRISNVITADGPKTVGEVITDSTTFGDGETPLEDGTFCVRPNTDGGFSEFSYYFKSDFYSISETKTIKLSDEVGKHIIVFNGEDLEETISIHDAIVDRTILSVIYRNGEGDFWLFADEKHGKERSGEEHLEQHMTVGCVYESGFDIEGIDVGSTEFTSIQGGKCWDEDIRLIIDERDNATFVYMTNDGDWNIVDSDSYIGYKTDGNVLYNKKGDEGEWLLEELEEGQFCTTTFIATNDVFNPINKIVGQVQYSSIESARSGIGEEISNMEKGDAPSPETIGLYSIIVNHLGEVVAMQDLQYIFDLRKTRYDFTNDFFAVPTINTANLASLTLEDNKIFWHKEANKYVISNIEDERWTYLALGGNFLPPAEAGTWTETWDEDIDDINEKWTGNINDEKDVANEYWSFEQNSTGSSDTGPDGPKEGDWYIYTETSGGGDDIDYKLETSYFADLTEVDFWWNAYGEDVGHVSLEYKVGDDRTEAWSVDGDQGEGWNNEVIDFTDMGVDYIRFRHNGMDGYHADVAFDKIKITSE